MAILRLNLFDPLLHPVHPAQPPGGSVARIL